MTHRQARVVGQRVKLYGAPGELSRLDRVRATIVGVYGQTAVVRFDSPKLLHGRQCDEIEVRTEWLVDEHRPVTVTVTV